MENRRVVSVRGGADGEYEGRKCLRERRGGVDGI